MISRRLLIFFLGFVVLMVCVPPMAAQSHGYVFTGVAFNGPGTDAAFRYGVGGDFTIAPFVTAGAEIGGIRDNGNGIVGSVNLGIHPRRHAASGLDPFLTCGFTGVRVGGDSGVYVNLGGGANYWLHRHAGFRAEFRTYAGGQDLNNFSEFRFGISLR
jgi:hypothetical protein